jgi:hypothetical protein
LSSRFLFQKITPRFQKIKPNVLREALSFNALALGARVVPHKRDIEGGESAGSIPQVALEDSLTRGYYLPPLPGLAPRGAATGCAGAQPYRDYPFFAKMPALRALI